MAYPGFYGTPSPAPAVPGQYSAQQQPYNMAYSAAAPTPYYAGGYSAPYPAVVPPSAAPNNNTGGFLAPQMGMPGVQYQQQQQQPYGMMGQQAYMGAPQQMGAFPSQPHYGSATTPNISAAAPNVYGGQAAYNLPANSPSFVGYNQTMPQSQYSVPSQPISTMPTTSYPQMGGAGGSSFLQPIVPTVATASPASTSGADDDFGGFESAPSTAPAGAQAIPSGAALFADPSLGSEPAVKNPNTLLEELQKSIHPIAAATPEKKQHEKASIEDIKSLLSQVAPAPVPTASHPTPALPVHDSPIAPVSTMPMTMPNQMQGDLSGWGSPTAAVAAPMPFTATQPMGHQYVSQAPMLPLQATGAPVVHPEAPFATSMVAQPPVQAFASPIAPPTPAAASDEEWGSWDGPSTDATPRTVDAFASFGATSTPIAAPFSAPLPSGPSASAPAAPASVLSPMTAMSPMAPLAAMAPTPSLPSQPFVEAAKPAEPAPKLFSLNAMSVGASLFSSAPEPESTPPQIEVEPSSNSVNSFVEPAPVAPTTDAHVMPASLPALASQISSAPTPTSTGGSTFGSGLDWSTPSISLSPGSALPPAIMPSTSSAIPTIVATPPSQSGEDDEWAEFASAPVSASVDFGPSQTLSPIPADFFNSSTGSLGSSQTFPAISSSSEVIAPALAPSPTPAQQPADDDWAEFSSAPAAPTVDPLSFPSQEPKKETKPAPLPISMPAAAPAPAPVQSGPLSDADLFAMLAAKSAPHTAPSVSTQKPPADAFASPFAKPAPTPSKVESKAPTLAPAPSISKAPSPAIDLLSLDPIAPPANPQSSPQALRKTAAAATPSKSAPTKEADKPGSQWTAQQVPAPAADTKKAADAKSDPRAQAPKTPSKSAAAPSAAPAAVAAPTLSVWEIDIKLVREAVDMPSTKGPAASGAKVASVLKGQSPQASEQEYALVARWQAALVMILRELKRAESFFANIKQTIAHQTPNDVEEFIEIAKHLLQEDRIVDYIQGVVEVYKISDRIQDCFFLNPPQFSLLESPDMPSLSGSLSAIAAAWKAVISSLDLLVGKGHKLLELPRAVDDSKKAKSGDESKLRCAVCATKLLRTEPVVKFGGKWGHSSCANFWVHRVRPDVSEAL